tara:strand:- start:37 stop:1287 length:1251 start_codon:yes stop_codon:yes gene_type:complete
MATPAQRTNTWILNEWYDQAVAGTQGDYAGDKQLWVWGNSNEGSLGLNDNVDRSSPTQLPAGGGAWSSIARRFSCASASTPSINNPAGNMTMFAIKTDGTLWGWGKNEQGEIPVNTSDSYSSPRQIPGSWTKCYQTRAGGAGFKTDGTLWIWGDNGEGMLGQNEKYSTRAGYSSPVQIPGTWSDLRGPDGGSSALAINTDGELWAWGQGAYGTLGQNEQKDYSSPVQIPGTWSHFSPGSGGSGVAAKVWKPDGSLWGWGSTSYGALGQNTSPGGGTERFSSPVQIPGTTWSNEGGGEVTIARKTDGTLWGMGRNGRGQLGLNSTIKYSSPVQIGNENTWSENIFCNDAYSGGVKTDGSLWLWGYGPNGKFGLNHRDTIGPGIDQISSPVQLPGSWPGEVGNSAALGFNVTYFMKNV